MQKRVVVWGTGNVGRPAIRAVLAHRDLVLAGVIVSNPERLERMQVSLQVSHRVV